MKAEKVFTVTITYNFEQDCTRTSIRRHGRLDGLTEADILADAARELNQRRYKRFSDYLEGRNNGI